MIQPTSTDPTFGATGDGTTNDTESILRTVAAAPGKTVFFPAGRYVVTKFIQITQSGTVLQGEGAARTTLLMPVPMNTISPRVYNNPASSLATTLYSWSGGMISLTGSGYSGETLAAVTTAAKRGDTTITVSDSSKLMAGTRIVLELTDNSARSLLAHVYRGDSGDLSKLKESYALQQVLTVVKNEGNTITVNRPLRADVHTEWNPLLKRYAPSLENCGVEHLTIEFPATPYRGHWTEEGFNPVEIKGAADCWLRGLKIVNPDSGPFIIGSVFCTLDGIELVSSRKSTAKETDVQGHHGISLMGVDCLSRNFRIGMKFFHDLTVSRGSTGNVFSNGVAADLAIDHHRHAPYENLFTQIDAGLGTRLWTSGGSTGQGKHTAAGAVFWNIKTRQDIALPPPDFAPDGGLILAGLKMRARKSEMGNHHFETISPGSLEPPNLHEAQRLRRRGSGAPGTPDAGQTWTSIAGSSIRAAFVRIEGANVLLIKDGKTLTAPLQSLSPASATLARTLESQRRGK